MVRWLFLAVALFAWPTSAAERVALVIGNANYAHVGKLSNPINDAKDIGEALEGAGFEVIYGFDLTLSETLEKLKGFKAEAAKANATVIYYAGHGIEIDRKNFMIPVDAKLADASDVEFEAIPLDLTLASAAVADGLSLVIMDACRDNPFAAQMRKVGATRSIGRGLGAVEPTGNTLVAYAAREGTVAADGKGRNSPYAAALIKAIKTDGLEIGKLLRQVRDDVLSATGGIQEPFVYGSLSAEDWYFRKPVPVATRSEGPIWRDVFRHAGVIHVGDDEIAAWPEPKPVGRCYRVPLGINGHVRKLRVSFVPFGVENVVIVFKERRRLVRQPVRKDERTPDYWGRKIKVDLQIDAKVKKTSRLAICARRLKGAKRPGDRDDFMLRQLIVQVAAK